MAVYRQSKKDKQKQFDNIRKKTKFITDEYGYFMKKEKMSLPSKILLSSIAANIICFIVFMALLLVPVFLNIDMNSEYKDIVVKGIDFSIHYFLIINIILAVLWLIVCMIKKSPPREFTPGDAVRRMLYWSDEYVEFSNNGVFITSVDAVPHEGSAGELRRRVLYAADTVKAVHSSELGMTVIYGEVYEFIVQGIRYSESEYNALEWKPVNNKYGKIIALSDTFKNQENGSFDIGRQISESLNVIPEETDVKGMVDFIMLYDGMR